MSQRELFDDVEGWCTMSNLFVPMQCHETKNRRGSSVAVHSDISGGDGLWRNLTVIHLNHQDRKLTFLVSFLMRKICDRWTASLAWPRGRAWSQTSDTFYPPHAPLFNNPRRHCFEMKKGEGSFLVAVLFGESLWCMLYNRSIIPKDTQFFNLFPKAIIWR